MDIDVRMEWKRVKQWKWNVDVARHKHVGREHMGEALGKLVRLERMRMRLQEGLTKLARV